MSTTIDSLQIEIQSSSASAANGIRDLAKAMGELKTNGSIKVAIKNLNALSEELGKFRDASNASRSIGKVYGALKSLKEIGSVKTIATGISKLGESLGALENVKVDDDLAPKMKRIAEALEPLSKMKSGAGSLINSLARLKKVTEGLDDTTINRFAERVQKLNTVLEPLSAKMTTISAGLRGINSSARNAGNGIREMGEDVDGARVNLASFIYIVQEAVQWVQQAIQVVTDITA